MQPANDDELVVDARARHLRANGFSEAAYAERWVRVRFGPIPIVFPNVASRRRAIPRHDLHHVATGYATTPTGEAEIAAWEIAACRTHRSFAPYWLPWLLNTGAFTLGLGFAPRRVYRAFIRGRHSRTLYEIGWTADLLQISVGELRRRLGLDAPVPRPTWGDRATFAALVGVVLSPAIAVAAVAAIVLSW